MSLWLNLVGMASMKVVLPQADRIQYGTAGNESKGKRSMHQEDTWLKVDIK